MTTVLIDYDSGNLHSAQKAFERMALEMGVGSVIVSSEADVVAAADRIVLPGDGAFPHCRDALFGRTALAEAIVEAVTHRAVPFMGICVGMQMMATTGHEHATTEGFDWIDGNIQPIIAPSQKIPHMGWNNLIIDSPHPVLEGIKSGNHVYFVHSYAMNVTNLHQRLAHVDYAGDITAVVGRDNIIGMQFHPEKSQESGLRMIGNFLRWAP